MKNLHRYITVLLIVLVAAMTTGCGKDDKLVMVTTEKSMNVPSDTDADVATESLADELAATVTTTEEEVVREEVSGEEAAITLEQIHDANRGDALLAGGNSYSLNTIYYANDAEVYSEYQFVGFDADGNYLQAYEDSDGFVQILDNANSSWYIIDGTDISALIYPEPGVAEAIIDYNHNELLISSPDESDETIKDIYRADGELTVETSYRTESTEYIFEYVLTDDLKIMAITCYDTEGTKISYAWVTNGVTYEVPEEIDTLRNSESLRNVTVAFPDGDGVECIYSVSPIVPAQVRMVEYSAYSDSECTVSWSEMELPESGLYEDETIYMKK